MNIVTSLPRFTMRIIPLINDSAAFKKLQKILFQKLINLIYIFTMAALSFPYVNCSSINNDSLLSFSSASRYRRVYTFVCLVFLPLKLSAFHVIMNFIVFSSLFSSSGLFLREKKGDGEVSRKIFKK